MVFPACAGVILRSPVLGSTFIGFPRMRGGDPAAESSLFAAGWFSPHARG